MYKHSTAIIYIFKIHIDHSFGSELPFMFLIMLLFCNINPRMSHHISASNILTIDLLPLTIQLWISRNLHDVAKTVDRFNTDSLWQLPSLPPLLSRSATEAYFSVFSSNFATIYLCQGGHRFSFGVSSFHPRPFIRFPIHPRGRPIFRLRASRRGRGGSSSSGNSGSSDSSSWFS